MKVQGVVFWVMMLCDGIMTQESTI